MPVLVATASGGTDTLTAREVIAILQQYPGHTPVTTFERDYEVPLTRHRIKLIEPVLKNSRGKRLQIG